MTREQRDLARRDTLAEKRRAHMRRFLDLLAETGNASSSALGAGIANRTVHTWRKDSAEHPDDPAWLVDWPQGDELAPFHERYLEAWDAALDRIEESLLQRATVGVEEPVFYKGQIVGHVRKRSDLAAFAVLRARRPELYARAEVKVEHSGSVNLPTETARERLTGLLLMRIERQQLAAANPATVIDVQPLAAETVAAPRDEE